MIQALGSFGPPLIALIVVSLAVGLPVVFVLAIRFLWDPQLHLGRSRELDKLVWQLHRIASALEQQRGLSLPAEQPATERPEAKAVAQRPVAAVRPIAQAPAVQNSAAQAPAAQAAAPQQPTPAQAPANPAPAAQPAANTAVEEHPRAGVNSMFGF
jgi:hypothetical protein